MWTTLSYNEHNGLPQCLCIKITFKWHSKTFSSILLNHCQWDHQLCVKLFGHLHQTPALRIITYLSISDVCISLTTPPIMAVLLTKYPDTRNCTWETIAAFSNTFFGHVSGLMLCFKSYDRYASIRYLTDYKIKLSARRVNLFLCLVIAGALLSSLTYTIGGIYRSAWTARILVSIDFLIISCGITFYILARRISRQRATDDVNNRFQSVNQAMNSLTSMVLKTILLFCLVYLVTGIIHSIFYKRAVTREAIGWLEFMQLYSVLIVLTNSIVNAVIVLVMNKKAKRFLMRNIPFTTTSKKYFQSNEEKQKAEKIASAVTTVC